MWIDEMLPGAIENAPQMFDGLYYDRPAMTLYIVSEKDVTTLRMSKAFDQVWDSLHPGGEWVRRNKEKIPGDLNMAFSSAPVRVKPGGEMEVIYPGIPATDVGLLLAAAIKAAKL